MELSLIHIYSTGAIAETVWNTTDPASEAFQEAGNWVGILFAVQAVGSVAVSYTHLLGIQVQCQVILEE